jgi:hypothetical protein
MGDPQELVGFMENPIYKWMITWGTPIFGNPHIDDSSISA